MPSCSTEAKQRVHVAATAQCSLHTQASAPRALRPSGGLPNPPTCSTRHHTQCQPNTASLKASAHTSRLPPSFMARSSASPGVKALQQQQLPRQPPPRLPPARSRPPASQPQRAPSRPPAPLPAPALQLQGRAGVWSLASWEGLAAPGKAMAALGGRPAGRAGHTQLWRRGGSTFTAAARPGCSLPVRPELARPCTPTLLVEHGVVVLAVQMLDAAGAALLLGAVTLGHQLRRRLQQQREQRRRLRPAASRSQAAGLSRAGWVLA